MRSSVLMNGMHGIGDNLHERAVVRELRQKYDEVWLTTSWPQLYWDMDDVHLLPRKSTIPWMLANEQKYVLRYETEPPPKDAWVIDCSYPWGLVRRTSVLEAMSTTCGVPVGDFRFPIAPIWAHQADQLLRAWAPTKPVLIHRPLLALTGKRNARSAQAKLARNPHLGQYHMLFQYLREDFFVVSVADLLDERIISEPVDADIECHHGELTLEVLAALVARASLVYCSPSFMTVLAQAVGTPQVCVFGGFEGPNSFAPGAQYAPWFPVTPLKSCACWGFDCKHDKRIDLWKAQRQARAFIKALNGNSVDTANTQEPLAVAG